MNFSQKQFLLILAAWFVISFGIMWVMGGACLNPVNGTNCRAIGAFDALRSVPIIGLLLPYDAWNSLMYFFTPITGFFLAFFLIRWWDSYFDSKEASGILFLVIIIFALLVGYYINLSFYVGESANLNSRTGVKYSLSFCWTQAESSQCNTEVQKINNEYISQAQKDGATTVQQLIPVSYWPELRKSIYLTFLLGALAGWLPLFIKGIIERQKTKD